MAPSNYLVNGVDFDDIFEPRGSQTPGSATGLAVNGTDINQRYYPRSAGGSNPAVTGYSVGGVDLNTLFAAKGSIVSYGETWRQIGFMSSGTYFAKSMVVFGNNLVAVGSGSITSTDNGSTWGTWSNVGTTLDAAVVHNGLIVGVGAGGVIRTSNDAATWSPRTSNTTLSFNSVASNGTRVVAVGANRVILASTDGVNWTSQYSLSTGVTLLHVTHGNGAFMAVGYHNMTGLHIYMSSDGLTWGAVSPGVYAYGSPARPEFGNGHWVIPMRPFNEGEDLSFLIHNGTSWSVSTVLTWSPEYFQMADIQSLYTPSNGWIYILNYYDGDYNYKNAFFTAPAGSPATLTLKHTFNYSTYAKSLLLKDNTLRTLFFPYIVGSP